MPPEACICISFAESKWKYFSSVTIEQSLSTLHDWYFGEDLHCGRELACSTPDLYPSVCDSKTLQMSSDLSPEEQTISSWELLQPGISEILVFQHSSVILVTTVNFFCGGGGTRGGSGQTFTLFTNLLPMELTLPLSVLVDIGHV
jgi:hypothetical protein